MANVTLENISRRYGSTTAVEEMSFSIQSGQFLTLLGPSGCGKSTTLRMIAGLLQPSTGRILLDGADVTALGPAKRNIGMVFQSLALFPHMTAAENVAFGLRMRKINADARDKRVRKMLDIVQLGHLSDRYPNQLSGGQQQRIALARAMVIEPSILILDEPFGALDRKLREAMQVELRQITRELGTTALFVTHDQEEALMMSDLIAVMGQGRVQQLGKPVDIYRRPANHFVADFVGMTNVFDAEPLVEAGASIRVRAFGSVFPVQPAPAVMSAIDAGRPMSVAVRPEEISLAAGERAMPEQAERAVVRGRILQSTYHGHMSSYAIELSGGQVLHARESNADLIGEDAQRFPVGAEVLASWKAESTRLFERPVA